MSRWFRLYDEILDDPKVQRLAPAVFKAWINLLALASRNGGLLPPVDDIAFALRIDAKTVSSHLRALTAEGLLDNTDGILSPHNWNERQFTSDRDPTATERKRRQRERTKSRVTDDVVTHHVTRDISVPSQPPDTDTDTDRGEVGRARDPLEAELRKAAGWQNEPAPMLAVTGEIQALIDNGADIDLDVIPVVAALAPKCQSRTTWRYFINAIARQRDSRISAAHVVSQPSSLKGRTHAATQQKPSRANVFAAIDARIEAAERSGSPEGFGDDEGDPQRAA